MQMEFEAGKVTTLTNKNVKTANTSITDKLNPFSPDHYKMFSVEDLDSDTLIDARPAADTYSQRMEGCIAGDRLRKLQDKQVKSAELAALAPKSNAFSQVVEDEQSQLYKAIGEHSDLDDDEQQDAEDDSSSKHEDMEDFERHLSAIGKEWKSLEKQEALLPPKKKAWSPKKRGVKKRDNYVLGMIQTMLTGWKESKAMVVKTKEQRLKRTRLNNKISAQESRTNEKLKKKRKSVQSRQKD